MRGRQPYLRNRTHPIAPVATGQTTTAPIFVTKSLSISAATTTASPIMGASNASVSGWLIEASPRIWPLPGLRTSGRAGPRRASSTIWRPDNRSGLGLRQGWTAHFLEKREKLWAFASVDTALLVLAV